MPSKKRKAPPSKKEWEPKAGDVVQWHNDEIFVLCGRYVGGGKPDDGFHLLFFQNGSCWSTIYHTKYSAVRIKSNSELIGSLPSLGPFLEKMKK